MIRRFSNAPLKTKLRFIIMLTSSISLLLIFLSFLLYDALKVRQKNREELSSMAEMIANNLSAAVLFNDPIAASRILRSLKDNSNIFAVYIITNDNRIFAKYIADNTSQSKLKLESPVRKSSDLVDPEALNELKKESGSAWDFDLDLEMTKQIILEGEELGTVVIQAHALDMILQRMRGFIIIAAIFLSVAFVVLYMISDKLQKLISAPILKLSETMKQISGNADYTVRVEKKTEDEVGMLYEGFNKMLDGIQERDLKLAKASDDWRATFDATEEIIVLMDANYVVVKSNAACSSFLGRPLKDIINRSIEELFSSESDFFTRENLSLLTGNSDIHSGKEVFIQTKGIWLDISISLIKDKDGKQQGAVLIIRDITRIRTSETEQQRLQEQLLQMQKMDSIGRLAGGIAHDFNNILASIMGYCELAMMKLPEDDQIRKHLGTIHESGKKAAALTRQLLLFSRKQPMEIKLMNLNIVIDSMTKMFSRLLGENISLKISTNKSLFNINADVSKIEQVIMNLVINAKDAMPSGGTISIRTDNIELATDDLMKQSMVMLEVIDTGHGMTREIQEKIFDPFFTTKDLGKGTGLGLSTVYAIVTQHKGRIEVLSEPQKGSSFRIYLPATDAKTERITVKSQTTVNTGTECILIAEDDEQLRELTSSILIQAGYSVVAAADGIEAIDMFRQHGHKIHLALLDMLMPGKNGKEVYRSIKSIKPEIQALFMSGYTADIISDNGILEEGVELINKPISNEELLMKIRQKLDS